ncbi:MAG: hypothetical protein JRJ51_22925, partial [Deltaproteobacteria bacterium]|nr:hypothetical protein [Deltaproteobacteria bacterium]
MIKWTFTGTQTTDVRVYYDTGPQTFVNEITTVPVGIAVGDADPTKGALDWDIPDNLLLGTNTRVKVVDSEVGFTYVNGISDKFKLTGSITLTSPRGTGTTVDAGTTPTVDWTFKGLVAAVKVYYDLDASTPGDWIALLDTSTFTHAPVGSTSGSGLLTWNMPTTVTNNAAIRVEESGNPSVYDECLLDPFKISAAFNITFPENGQIVYAEDKTTNITWGLAGTGIGKIMLYYSNNSEDATPTWIPITPGGIDQATSYNWDPIPGLTADVTSTDHRIKITQLVPDNEAEAWDIGGYTNQAVDGTPFPILVKFVVDVPALDEEWELGTTQTIKFKKQGAAEGARVYYSKDGTPGAYVEITGAVKDLTLPPDEGEYYTVPWDIDSATYSVSVGNAGTIKVEATAPAPAQVGVKNYSNGFVVKGSITNVAIVPDDPLPLGTDMNVGGSKKVTWQRNGDIGTFRVEYRYVDELSVQQDWSQITPGGGVGGTEISPDVFTWLWDPAAVGIPDTISADVDFRVSDETLPLLVRGESAVDYKILGQLAVLQPSFASEDKFYINDDLVSGVIEWSKTGDVKNLTIDYSVTGTFVSPADDDYIFEVTNGLLPGTDAGPNYFPTNYPVSNWVIPNDAVSDVCVMRIRNEGAVAGTELTALSVNVFKIRPKITLINRPALDEELFAEKDGYEIKWTAISAPKNGVAGDWPEVTITYDAGLGDQPIAADVDCEHGPNTFIWDNLPDVKSAAVTIKIEFEDYPGQGELLVSDPFVIRPEIKIDEPVLD